MTMCVKVATSTDAATLLACDPHHALPVPATSATSCEGRGCARECGLIRSPLHRVAQPPPCGNSTAPRRPWVEAGEPQRTVAEDHACGLRRSGLRVGF